MLFPSTPFWYTDDACRNVNLDDDDDDDDGDNDDNGIGATCIPQNDFSVQHHEINTTTYFTVRFFPLN